MPTAAFRRSSACASALALALGAAGCGGGGGGDRRDQVEAYLKEANAVQRRAAPELKRANQAYVEFAQRKLAPKDAAVRLAAAESSIRSARASLGKIDPPPAASELHRRLLHLYDLDAGLAAETTALGRYLPGVQHVLAPLPRLNARLRRGLRGSSAASDQAAALGTFSDGLERLVAALRDLEPPPLLATTHRAQIARLERTSGLATRLRGAIKARDAKAVATVLRRFRTLSARAGDGNVLEKQALGAYNDRYRALRTAAIAVERERSRLDKTLT